MNPIFKNYRFVKGQPYCNIVIIQIIFHSFWYTITCDWVLLSYLSWLIMVQTSTLITTSLAYFDIQWTFTDGDRHYQHCVNLFSNVTGVHLNVKVLQSGFNLNSVLTTLYKNWNAHSENSTRRRVASLATTLSPTQPLSLKGTWMFFSLLLLLLDTICSKLPTSNVHCS